MKTGDIKKWLAFGTGVGIEIRGDDLEVTVARVRPLGVRILGTTTIVRFRQRPASEWGAEYARFLTTTGGSHLAAAVLLPRREMVVRRLSLPGVASRDMDAAIRFQVDSLHPYPEEEAAYGWARIAGTPLVLVGIARSQVIEHYGLLFAEAGLRVASFTFSAAVIHSAIRLLSSPPEEGFLIFHEQEGRLEAYGESPARPVFSATFDLPPEKVAPLAAAELRLDGDIQPLRLAELLPAPGAMPAEADLSRSAISYATALAGACPWLALSANLLPAGQRSSSSRALYVPTIALAALLLIGVGILAAYGGIEDRRYLSELQDEIAAFTPEAGKVGELDKDMEALRARRQLLSEFRQRTKADLDVLQELTRILAPPAWLKSLQLSRTGARLSGEATQAAPLLEIIDNSPLFRNSEFTNPMSKVGKAESFAIRTEREAENAEEAK